MTKNIKSIFFILTLVMLLVTVGAVCAADDNGATTDNTTTSTSSISEKTTTTEPVVKEKIENTQTKELKTDKTQDKTITKINKTQKNTKTSTKTVEVNNFDELTNTVNEASNDSNFDKYIINLQNGTYISPTINWLAGTGNVKDIIINGNNQTILIRDISSVFRLNNGINFYFNDLSINTKVTNYYNATFNNVIMNKYGAQTVGNGGNESYDASFVNAGNMTFINSTIKGSGNNRGVLTISNDTIIEPTFFFWKQNGTIIIDDMDRILHPNPYDGNKEITNQNITENITIPTTGNITLTQCNISAEITNKGNITLTNCQINAKITNNGNLTLINCSLSNNNLTTSGSKTDGFLVKNNGKVTMIGCTVENNTFNATALGEQSIDIYGAIVNNGFMSIVNSLFDNNRLGFVNITSGLLHANVCGDGAVLTNTGTGTLLVDNSTFQNGYAAGYGGAINNQGNLTVNNSYFINNTVNSGGSAISNNNLNDISNQGQNKLGVYNSEFIGNYVNLTYNNVGLSGGGAIADTWSNDWNNHSIINCTFKDNCGEYTGNIDLAGVSGEGGALLIANTYNITNCTFTNNNVSIGKVYHSYRTNTSIDNCIFENSVITDNCGINITNNIFKENSGILMRIDNMANAINKLISDNNFTDNNISTYYDGLRLAPNTITLVHYSGTELTKEDVLEKINLTIKDNQYTNTSLHDEITLNIPDNVYTGEPVTITGTYTLLEPENYDTDILEQTKYNIFINGELIQTVDTLEFTITPTNGTMMVTVQPTISQTRKTEAIRATTLTDIIVTPENYNEYIYEGSLIGVSKDSKIIFQGTFTDKGEIYIDTSDIIIDGSDATFTNTKFTLDAENIVLQNMNINNTNLNYPISNYKDNNIISNNTITLNNPNSNATAIYNGASNTLIANNTLTVTALAGSIDFSVVGVADTQAILLLGGDKNIVQNNNINIKSTQAIGYNTLEAITNSNGATNTLITQNTINIQDANFNYAIDSLSNVENITITENTITVTGERYCDGIQVGNGATNILVDNNNITCTCINTTVITEEGAITYGVIAASMGSAESENITITNNNIDITGTVNYAIELYKVNNTQIHSNNITVNGPYSLAIGYSYAPNGNATQNTITINGDSTTPINYITEEIKPENTGIRIQNGTQNISITDNTITTSDVGGQDTTIHTEPDNVTIANNQLTSSNGYGDETIIAPTTANIENNIIETTTTLEVPETIITNTPVELTATVTTNDGNPITGGTILFTIGNEVITSTTVTDGTATAATTFTQEGDATIVASYTPESTGLSTSSAEATTSIQNPITQLNIEEIELTAGKTITLTATVTDQNGNNLNGGKVIFKVNGKTVKDANGKVIYAKVVDGVAQVEYAVPDNLAGKDVNITAVYSGSTKYNKESTTITKTVTAPEPTLTITPITDDVQTGSTITLKAKVAAGDKAITTGKIVFKINGKTVKDTNGKVIYAKVDANGEVSVDYNLGNFKAGSYTIEATFIAPNYDKITSNSTMTIVKA